jgi:uncharacterized protein YsxB (DUF464 family)
MVRFTVYQNNQKEYRGFKSEGHAGFAQAGEDIVCAAVSALVMTAVNSLEAFTQEAVCVNVKKEPPVIELSFQDIPGKEAGLLMDSLVLGIQGIAKQYKKYIKLTFKEV